MLGALFPPPPPVNYLVIGDKKISVGAAQAFIADLYENAGTGLPNDFNPVNEIIRIVDTLRQQGKINNEQTKTNSI